MKRIFIFMVFSLFLLGCSSVKTQGDFSYPLEKKLGLVVLKNNTETPLAGFRASSILEGILEAREVKVKFYLQEKLQDEYLPQEVNKFLLQAKEDGLEYLLSGEVNEWRYKTGIDGEPAVSVRLALWDVQQESIVWSGVGAKSGWGHESLGTVAQEVLLELVEEVF